MARKAPEIVELSHAETEALLKRAETGTLSAEDYDLICKVFASYVYVTEALANKNTTLARLRRILFGAATEKTSSIVGAACGESTAGDACHTSASTIGGGNQDEDAKGSMTDATSKASTKGHGRLGASAYVGAHRFVIPHATLKVGMACPECVDGILYATAPGVLVRMGGQPPLGSKIYELEKLRCNLCGEIYSAAAPPGMGAHKYDETACSMIGLLKYGGGFPFHRLEKFQDALEIPLPAATQWDIVQEGAVTMEPAYGELVRQAAQGEVLHNDDTRMTILALKGKRLADRQASSGSESETIVRNKDGSIRKDVSTSGIVSTHEGHKIALFFTSPLHAGENLDAVLRHRRKELAPPIQMSDGLSRNLPAALQTIVANCLTHARRKFVDSHPRFPKPCEFVFAVLKEVYIADSEAREQRLSPEERLRFHQRMSGPRMAELHEWMTRQFADRLVEPNSELGEAMRYMLKHWEPLTLFLRVAGAPLDNNLCERVLKRAILHRKNSLFYMTENGARVGDLYMTLIHTCQLNGVNAFDYLNTLQRESAAVLSTPEQWMPWNYADTIRDRDAGSPPNIQTTPANVETKRCKRERRLAQRMLRQQAH